ncbi:RNA-directed DNA polymerase, eukaryota, partial [Tanacetum coccineum]
MALGDFNDWKEVSYKKHRSNKVHSDLPSIQKTQYAGRFRSKEDDVGRISVNVFVTNFPDNCLAKDLFHHCSQYGHVVDSFIPNKRSKSGKRFGFVKFINVFNNDRLVSNISTVWIGRYKLQAHLAKYARPSINNRSQVTSKGQRHVTSLPPKPRSFANVVNNDNLPNDTSVSDTPDLVLENECGSTGDLSNNVIGKVKDFQSIPNIKMVLAKEGFGEFEVSYLGGFWVMIELNSVETQRQFMQHQGVNSWFQEIRAASSDFVSKDRIVWVDIEGIPLNVWTNATFNRIGKKWGDVMAIEESSGSSYARKRLCIKTNLADNILESFKVIFKGKSYRIRAKELFTWSPCFLEYKESDDNIDDEVISNHNVKDNQDDRYLNEDALDGNSDEERVHDSIFGEEIPIPNNENEGSPEKNVSSNSKSVDPFGIYDLLNNGLNQTGNVPDPSLSHPPGFTPAMSHQDVLNEELDKDEEVNNSPPNQNTYPQPQFPQHQKEGSNFSDTLSDFSSNVPSRKSNKGGSILNVLEDIIKVGHSMGYVMEGCSKDMEHIIGSLGDIAGNSGGILCVWEQSIFKKDGVTVSDNFIALYGTWVPTNTRILIVVVYAPQAPASKHMLWDYISSLINRWDGETIVMGDFNAVRSEEERFGSVFNRSCARYFNQFITSSGLVDVKMEGYSFTWSHPSASKMSKIDRFLVSDGIFSIFPAITAICLERHLSDHRPIILKEISSDYGPIPFRMYHSWFKREGFDDLVRSTWQSFSHNDTNSIIRFKKKLQDLKKTIRVWIKAANMSKSGDKNSCIKQLEEIDKTLDSGVINDELLLNRLELTHRLFEAKQSDLNDMAQKAKVKWAIGGDENSKFFHGIINKRRAQLAIRGVFDNGVWQTDPVLVKKSFLTHFATQFKQPTDCRLKLNMVFPNTLSPDQIVELDRPISVDEIKAAVWDCGENKSPGPDGFSFEFYRHFWDLISPDLCAAVSYFFDSGGFPRGCNSTFIALIPKVMDAKLVSDFRPISLIGSVYKVITKILANRLSLVISDLVSNTQTAFVKNRHILDGPFILSEALSWCKSKKKQALVFKVDFAKAYDSVRWDFLLDALQSFGFSSRWCSWIRGIFSSNMASILVNGSPTDEFPIACGLKQGDPLAPLLFILVMETLHISVTRAVNDGVFKGFHLSDTMVLSHLFYADDALFIGEWSDENLANLIRILNCFHLASGLRINLIKSQVMGIGVPTDAVNFGAASIGCSVMNTPFKYLGVTVGDNMSRHSAWSDVMQKVRSRLSSWKAKTLSIGGRLTLLKAVLGAVPLYFMSIYKAPKGVLHELEKIRNKFFIGADSADRKISWVAWKHVLAGKKRGGLGVSSYFALNRALLLKCIQAIHGKSVDSHDLKYASCWNSILRELNNLSSKGFNFKSHCKIRVGNGVKTRFWLDKWVTDQPLCTRFPRIFALERNKAMTIDSKRSDLTASFRRQIRDGVESHQWAELLAIFNMVSFSSSEDRWYCDLNGDGMFHVKDIRLAIDEIFLPGLNENTRW